MSITITKPMVWDVYYHSDDSITMVIAITSDNMIHTRSIKKITDYDNNFGYHGSEESSCSVTMVSFMASLAQATIIKAVNLQLPL